MILYFKTLKYLIFMFSMFTILSIPSYLVYSAGDIDEVGGSVELKGVMTDLTAGNIGENSQQCST